MTIEMTSAEAFEVVLGLKSGIPSRRFVSTYSRGYDDLLSGVERRLLRSATPAGQLKFLSGSWGSGKTHLLRLLAERAFERDFLVATVELGKAETPFNKFELVVARITRDVTSPEMYARGDLQRAIPFGEALHQGLLRQATPGEPIEATFGRERTRLMANDLIDIDMRRAVCAYWETYTANLDQDASEVEEQRGVILQWFMREGRLVSLRKHFGINKMLDQGNAQELLRSLGQLSLHLGYAGLLVLLDEAEMSYSIMRRASLREAQNNLLTLINTINSSRGLILVYATTPDFYDDNNYGIRQYGALSGRIGQPENKPPKSLQRVWNLDALDFFAEDYRCVARSLKEIYVLQDPEAEVTLPSDDELDTWVDEMVAKHPKYSQMNVWRWLVTGLIEDFDHRTEGGGGLSTDEVSKGILDRLNFE